MSEELLSVKWSDIESPTLNPKEYMEKYGEKEVIKMRYNKYQPDETTLMELRNELTEKGEKMHVLAIGASWCHDCADEVPRMAKIAMELPDSLEFRILYGVKVDPYDRKNGVRWSERHSPAEATDPKFDLKKIPIFFLFNNDGEFIGRIIEHPKKTETLEKELLHYLQST